MYNEIMLLVLPIIAGIIKGMRDPVYNNYGFFYNYHPFLGGLYCAATSIFLILFFGSDDAWILGVLSGFIVGFIFFRQFAKEEDLIIVSENDFYMRPRAIPLKFYFNYAAEHLWSLFLKPVALSSLITGLLILYSCLINSTLYFRNFSEALIAITILSLPIGFFSIFFITPLFYPLYKIFELISIKLFNLIGR